MELWKRILGGWGDGKPLHVSLEEGNVVFDDGICLVSIAAMLLQLCR